MDAQLQVITFLRLVMITLVPYVLAAQGTMLGGRIIWADCCTVCWPLCWWEG